MKAGRKEDEVRGEGAQEKSMRKLRKKLTHRSSKNVSIIFHVLRVAEDLGNTTILSLKSLEK